MLYLNIKTLFFFNIGIFTRSIKQAYQLFKPCSSWPWIIQMKEHFNDLVFFSLGYSAVRFPGSSGVRNLPEMQETQETWVWTLGREDPLEEGMASHSSILGWKIPWTEETSGLWPIGPQKVRHDCTQHSAIDLRNWGQRVREVKEFKQGQKPLSGRLGLYTQVCCSLVPTSPTTILLLRAAPHIGMWCRVMTSGGITWHFWTFSWH